MKDLLTIVIPCKNERYNIEKTLLSLPAEVRVIVADSSNDDTLDFIPQGTEIISGGLPAIARNLGGEKVITPYVLFLDADMDISRVPLEKILSVVIKDDVYLATTHITVKSWRRIFYWTFAIFQRIISMKSPFAVGGFMIFNTAEFRRLGGFNNNDKFAEDFHLSMKVKREKFRIFRFPAYTSERRLEKKSLFYMIKLMISCWLNRHNNEFYTKDYGYWS